MPQGLRVRDLNNNLVFDSTVASGGVCLGVYEITGPSTLTFPDHGADTVGFVLNTSGVPATYTFDVSLGYPRFTFGYRAGVVSLFVR